MCDLFSPLEACRILSWCSEFHADIHWCDWIVSCCPYWMGAGGLAMSDTCIHAVLLLVGSPPCTLACEELPVPEPFGGTVLGLCSLLSVVKIIFGRVSTQYLALRHSVKGCLMKKGKHLKFRVLAGPQPGCPYHWEGWSSQPSEPLVRVGKGVARNHWEAEVRRSVETDFPFSYESYFGKVAQIYFLPGV